VGRQIKLLFYTVCKLLGLFALARRLTRRGLRILGYHGFVLADENKFRQSIFMRQETLRRRLDYLIRKGYPVLPLAEALRRLDEGTLPPCATVLTFDDGFHSIWRLAVPLLLERGLPATIYVTTHHVQKRTPIFRLAFQYMLTMTKKAELDLTGLGLPESGTVSLADPDAKRRAARSLIHHAEEDLSEEQRNELAAELGRRLGVPFESIAQQRLFSLMTPEEISEATAAGIDIQLHTHRHRFPVDRQLAEREIRDCKAVLEPLVQKPLEHFCYPSGIYHPDHFPILRSMGIRSATTCEAGLNFRRTERMALRRFMDADSVSWIEFEADQCGFAYLMRWLRDAALAFLKRTSHHKRRDLGE